MGDSKRRLRAKILRVMKAFLGADAYKRFMEWRVEKKRLSDPMVGEKATGKKLKKQKEFGVNVVGYIRAESGVGEMSRGLIRALESSGINYSLCNLYQEWMREGDKTHTSFSDELPYSTSIIVANADVIKGAMGQVGMEKFKDSYNIGFWAWELPEFPEEWADSFSFLDEVWTISQFCLDSIKKQSPIPVRDIPLPVEFKVDQKYTRDYFKLPSDAFIFLFTFDGLSSIKRKNPFAVARAFAKNFKGNDDVALVIKCHNVQKDQMAELKKILKGCNYKMITRYYKRDVVLGLLNCIDCYVSLHRAEGFGYMLAEAMYLGKHVIATGWSGNMDFMNSDNSHLVDYSLVQIEEACGPYKKGYTWAEPDIDDAAKKMKMIYEKTTDIDPKHGQKMIRESYSLEAVASVVEKVLRG